MAVKAEDVAARLLTEFPHALRSGQLVTYFQPEVELSSGRVMAAESLARWEHPELGTLSPVLFTSLASKLGLMRELTQLILQLSLRQQRSWAMAGWDIPVSVNVGPECVADPQFPAVIADFLRREQIAGPKLTLEVSEQTRTVAVSSSFFAQLAEFGVRVALDDFGTGFASLESLGDWLRRGVVTTHQAAPLAPTGQAARPGWTRLSRDYQRLVWTGRRVEERVGAPILIMAAVMMAGYGLWQIFRWGGHQHQALIGDLLLLVPNGAVVGCAWMVSRHQDLGRRTCRAWRLLTVALCLYMLGDVLQLVYEVLLHRRPYPTWADAAYLSLYVVAFGGLMTFPSRRRTRSERLRLLLDMGTVFTGGVTLIWYVVLGPAIQGAGFNLPDLVTFAYPIGDMLLLFGALSLLWRGAPRGTVVPLRIFATGLLVFIAADVTYSYITVHSTYLGGDPVDTLWFLALILLLVAAGCQLRARPGGDTAPPLTAPAARPSVLPYLAVAGSYLLLVVVGLRHVAFNPLGGVLVGAVALTLLVTARQFAALRDNGRLAVRYAELASIDGMTGLYNRRHFMELSEGAFAHAQRVTQPLVALMIDVDNFKQINDVHGHAVGDRVLTDLARSCREHVRAGDIAGRYGGDEFIIMIPGTTSARAAQLAAGLTGPPARVTGADGSPVAFTLSVGIAESAGCRDLPSLLARADLAMYEAKRAGGGCFRVFQGTEMAPDAILPAG
ncbi:MAG TPA: GGDEF domain-containing protein [Streptosporangiaceae bacterium]